MAFHPKRMQFSCHDGIKNYQLARNFLWTTRCYNKPNPDRGHLDLMFQIQPGRLPEHRTNLKHFNPGVGPGSEVRQEHRKLPLCHR